MSLSSFGITGNEFKTDTRILSGPCCYLILKGHVDQDHKVEFSPRHFYHIYQLIMRDQMILNFSKYNLNIKHEASVYTFYYNK